MSAENPTIVQQPSTRMQRFANLVGGAVTEVGRDPSFQTHALHVGAESLLAAGVISQDSRGRTMPSFRGIADAIREPRRAFSAAAESAIPHLPDLAFRAGAIAVSHVANRIVGRGNETPRAAIQA